MDCRVKPGNDEWMALRSKFQSLLGYAPSIAMAAKTSEQISMSRV
jgi:hypothetical protein